MWGESREGTEEGRGGGRVEGLERKELGGKGTEGGEGKAAVKGEMVGGLLRNDQIPSKNLQTLSTDEQFCCLAMQLSHSLA